MNKKALVSLLAAVLCAVNAGVIMAGPGQHIGEQKMLTADIQFLSPYGMTETNASGTYYNYYGITVHEDKVYPPQYQGEFPLYFVGSPANIKVTVTNNGPRAKAKIMVKTEAYVLRTDGSSGMRLAAPRTIEAEVARGETVTLDASFMIEDQPGLDSGLDRFTVKVLHVNEGGGPGNSEPALIMQKEGVFCPPPKDGAVR